MVENVDLLRDERAPVKAILVVEDDSNIGEFLVEAIETETPYLAYLAADGLEALKMIESIRPNLLVLDYQLPLLNGLELYDRLQTREELKDIPVLFMSANVPQREVEKRRVYLIKKPFEMDQLLQTIGTLLTNSSPM